MAYEGSEEVNVILDKAERRIMDASERHTTREFTPITEIVVGAIDNINNKYASQGSLTGIPSGFKDLDKLTSGLQPSDLLLVAARPSMGKTAFTLNIAATVAIKSSS